MSLDAERAAIAIRRGLAVRMTVGRHPDDPVLVLAWLGDSVVQESVSGWSTGNVENVCEIHSSYLERHLKDARELEVVERDEYVALRDRVRELENELRKRDQQMVGNVYARAYEREAAAKGY